MARAARLIRQVRGRKRDANAEGRSLRREESVNVWPQLISAHCSSVARSLFWLLTEKVAIIDKI